MEEGSVGREVQQDGKNAGRKLSAKTIKAILELICDEAVSQGGRGGRDFFFFFEFFFFFFFFFFFNF